MTTMTTMTTTTTTTSSSARCGGNLKPSALVRATRQERQQQHGLAASSSVLRIPNNSANTSSSHIIRNSTSRSTCCGPPLFFGDAKTIMITTTPITPSITPSITTFRTNNHFKPSSVWHQIKGGGCGPRTAFPTTTDGNSNRNSAITKNNNNDSGRGLLPQDSFGTTTLARSNRRPDDAVPLTAPKTNQHIIAPPKPKCVVVLEKDDETLFPKKAANRLALVAPSNSTCAQLLPMVVSGQHDDNEEDHNHPTKGLKEAPGSEEEIPGDDDAPGGLATTNTNAQTQEATANNADEESGDVVQNVARNTKRNESTLLLLKQADNHHNHQPSRVSLLGHQQTENATTTNDKNKNNDNINTKVSSVATEEVDENTVADIDADSSSSPMMMPPPPTTTTTAPQTAIATVHNKEAQTKRVHDDCIQHNDTTTACGACTNPKVPPAAAAESMLLGNRGLPGSCGPANTSTTTSGGAGAGADALGPPALSSDLTQQPPKLGLVLHSLIQAVPAEYTKIKEDPNHYQSSDSSRVQVDGSSTKNQTRIAELATCMMMITGMDHDAAVLAQPPTIVPDDVAAAVEVVGADEDDDKENTESHNSGCGLSPNGDHDDDKDDDHDSSRKYQSETTSRGRNEEEAATVKEKSVPLASQQQGQTSLTIAPVDESYKEVLKSTSNMEDEENNGGISSMECPKKHLSSSTSNAQSSQQATKTKADQPMAFNSVATDMPTEQSQGKMLLVANPDDSPVLLPMKTFEDSEVETTAEYSNETKIILTDKNGMLLFSAESQSSDFSKRENNGEEVGEETKNEENPLTSTNGGRDEIMTLPIPGKQGSLLAAAVPDDADPHTAFQTSQQNCDKVPAASSTTEFLPTRTAQEQKAIYQSEGTKAQEPISDEALVALKEEENTHSDKTDDHLANSSDLKNSAIPANDACRTGTLAPEIELQPCTNPVPSASESYLLIKKKEKEGFVGCCNAAVPYKNNYLQSMPVLADVVVDVDDSVNTRCSEGDSILAHDNADIKDGEVDDPASDWDEFWCMPAPELLDALSTEFFDDMMKDCEII